MKRPQEFINELTDDDLKDAYYQLKDFWNTGVLKNGIVRNIHNSIESELGEMSYSLHQIERDILFEIAKRKYE